MGNDADVADKSRTLDGSSGKDIFANFSKTILSLLFDTVFDGDQIFDSA